MDVHRRILDFNAGRDPELLERKYARLASDPFVFLRGTCHLFFEDWNGGRTLDRAPLAWISGDLHLENFGSYKGDNRLGYFDINDFDEAALAPCTWEPARLLVSLHVAAKPLGFSRTQARALARDFVAAYVAALADGKPRWVERTLAQSMIRDLLDQVRRRKRRTFLDRRTRLVGRRRRLLVDGKHALPLARRERERLLAGFKDFAARQAQPEFFSPLDVARRVAGTGSLGLPRYVVLVRGKGSPQHNFLLDMKLAAESSAAARLPRRQPHWKTQSERIVTVQKRAEAIAPAFLLPLRYAGRDFVLKELQPSQDRLDLAQAQRKDGLQQVITTMGQLAAWSALRGSGHQGAANADALIAFARELPWQRHLLDYARTYAAQVIADWRDYRAAWRDGACTTETNA